MSDPKQKPFFEDVLLKGHALKLNQVTCVDKKGEPYCRSFTLSVRAVTFNNVTFKVDSFDYGIRYRVRVRFTDLDSVTVPYQDDKIDMMVAAAKAADPEFYATYTITPAHVVMASRNADLRLPKDK